MAIASSASEAIASADEATHSRPWPRPLLVVATILAIFIMTLTAFSNLATLLALQADRLDNTVAQSRFDDYVTFYAAGDLVLEGRGADLYNTEVLGAKERELMGRPVGGTGTLGFFNPPFVALLFAPLALLPVGLAGIVLFVINSCLVLGVTVILRKMLNLHGLAVNVLSVIAAISINSVFWLIGHGQLSMLLVVGFLGFYWFQRQGRPALSGLALALILVKPQMTILPILVLLWRRDWTALAPFISIAAVLGVVSLVVSGPAVLWEYPRFTLDSTGWDRELGINVERMYGWNGLFATIVSNHSPAHLALTGVATLVTVGSVIWAFCNAQAASGHFTLAFGAMVAGSILINPHIYLQDMVLVALIVVVGYVGLREVGRSTSLWIGAAALAWVTQDYVDRLFSIFDVNVHSLLLIAIFAMLLQTRFASFNQTPSRLESRLQEPVAA